MVTKLRWSQSRDGQNVKMGRKARCGECQDGQIGGVIGVRGVILSHDQGSWLMVHDNGLTTEYTESLSHTPCSWSGATLGQK